MSILGWLTGADKAAKAQKKGFKQAAALTREGQDKAEALLRPGATYQPAQERLMALLGLSGGQAQEDAYGDFREGPGVDFLRKQGEQAIQRTASAGGSLASGRTLADVSKFNQGLAETSFGDYFDRLTGMLESGKRSAGALAGTFSGTADRLGDLALGNGQAKAATATQNSPWSMISGVGAIGADLLGGYLGKRKTQSSIY